MRTNKTQQKFLIKAGLIVGAGGLIFGYDIGVISGTLSQLKNEFLLDNYQQGLVVSILYGGAILGSVVGGPLCDYLGRWKTIHIQNFIFILGAAVTGGANSFATLCAGRFIVGIASALSGIADVPYLTEISPPEHRGWLSSQYEILVCVGILVSFAVDLLLSSFSQGWRIAFIIPAVMALLQSIGMFFLPESPKWLMEKGRLEEAKIALSEIYGSQHLMYEIDSVFLSRNTRRSFSSGAAARFTDLPQDLIDYQQAVEERDRAERAKNIGGAAKDKLLMSYDSDMFDPNVDEEEESAIVFNSERASNNSSKNIFTNTKTVNTIGTTSTTTMRGGTVSSSTVEVSQDTGLPVTATEKEVFWEYQLSIAVIVVVQVLAQATGCNVVRNYAPSIFEDSGVSEALSLSINVALGAIKLAFTVVSVYFVDHAGRRSLMLYGIVLVSAGMLFLTLASFFSDSGNLSNPAVYTVGCAFVYAGFGIGYGPISWILASEMFPTVIRGRIMSISLVASNVAQLVVNMLFLVMTDHLTTAGTFGFFLGMNLLTWVLAYLYLVETKEISPAVILLSLRNTCTAVSTSAMRCMCCCCGSKEESATYQELSSGDHKTAGDVDGAEKTHDESTEEQDSFTANVLHDQEEEF